jgi:uncharacterized membrane protein required for colicin V production
MTLTIYDAAMAGVLVAGMVWGAWKGVTWQLASIASLILGYIVSHQLSVQLAPHFPGDPVVARALAMMAIYAVVSGGVFLVAWLFRAILRKMKFEAFDRHLGMLLGGMEAMLLGLLATFFVVSLAPSTRDPIFASPTGKLVGNLMNAVGPVLPSEAREALAPFIAEAKQAIATGEQVLPLLPTQSQSPPQAKDDNPARTSDANDGTVERR